MYNTFKLFNESLIFVLISNLSNYYAYYDIVLTDTVIHSKYLYYYFIIYFYIL